MQAGVAAAARKIQAGARAPWRRSVVNWARNIEYSNARFHKPDSVAALQSIVRDSDRVRALGSRHSFSRCADTEGDLVQLGSLPRCVSIENRVATCSAGTTYADLCDDIEASGWGLHAMASLPHLTVAGAIATATHGSGDRLGNLTTAVAGIEYVGADGELRTLEAGDDRLQA
eukprot:7144539-Prymnesium_polylepis.1